MKKFIFLLFFVALGVIQADAYESKTNDPVSYQIHQSDGTLFQMNKIEANEVFKFEVKNAVVYQKVGETKVKNDYFFLELVNHSYQWNYSLIDPLYAFEKTEKTIKYSKEIDLPGNYSLEKTGSRRSV